MAILNNSNAISAGGYDVNNSVRIRSSASAYFNRTPASAGNRQKFTYSVWHKSSLVNVTSLLNANSNSSNTDAIYFDSNKLVFESNVSGVNIMNLTTSQVFRDPSAWYHFVFSVDTTQATAANRIKIYVNGQQITVFTTATYPSQNSNLNINSNVAHNIGRFLSNGGTTYYSDGYYAETYFVDGQAKVSSDFGETDATTGVWKPKAYTGTYGTNGFYLKFSDIATTSGSNAGLGKDFSGNTNYWTTNNISVTSGTTYDAMKDSPTNTSATVANYAVLNPVDKSTGTITNANLTYASSSGFGARSTISMSSGKWYCEVTCSTASDNMLGILSSTENISTLSFPGNTSTSYGYYSSNGNKYNNGTSTAYGASYTTNDIIGIAFDADAGTLTYYKNGVSQGTAFSSIPSGSYSFGYGNGTSGGSFNFGQRPFSYTPPTGYVALNTYNLPTPTILQGNKYMDATLYVGNGVSQNVVTATGFKPDFVWIKDRTTAGQDNGLYDTVRGTGRTLYSNLTNAESSVISTLTAFNSNGYTVGTENMANKANDNFVGWSWQAGQGSTSSNTSGSITSTVSVNTTAGFSIVTYTGNAVNGATVGHGLGVAPKMIILKGRSAGTAGGPWYTYHASTGATNLLRLNTTAAAASDSVFYYTTPTANTFYLGAPAGYSNGSGETYVAYCWSEIAGFSRFGSYTGNGNVDGPFVYTGFRPKFVIVKRTDSTGDWYVIDSSRATYNQIGPGLNPNTSSAEFTLGSPTGGALDFLSNGFKWRGTYVDMNASGGTYIFMAFAENPFKNALAR